MARQLQEINQAYTDICAQLGDLSVRMNVTIPKKIRELEAEAEALQNEANVALQSLKAKEAAESAVALAAKKEELSSGVQS